MGVLATSTQEMDMVNRWLASGALRLTGHEDARPDDDGVLAARSPLVVGGFS